MPTVAALGLVVSGGTSTARSRVAWSRQPRRQPSASWPAVKVRTSWRVIGVALSEVTRMRHLWQVPWPPQVESIAMPFHDAASKTVTPGGTRTSRSAGGTSAPSSALVMTVNARATRPVPSWAAGSTPGLSMRPSRATSASEKSGPSGGPLMALPGGLESRGPRGVVRGSAAAEENVVGCLHARSASCFARCAVIHAMPQSSWPRNTSAALTASTTWGVRASMIALVSAEVVADASHHLEGHQARAGVGPDGHGQGVDDDVGLRDAVLLRGDADDLAGELDALVGLRRDLVAVVRQGDDRRVVLLDQRQDRRHAVVLGGDRVDQRTALVDREAGLERLDDRGVDADREVGQLLDHLDRLGQQLGLVGERGAHVDVEHVGAALDLRLDVALDRREVAVAELLLEDAAPGGVDPLADEGEARVVPDDHLAGGRTQDRAQRLGGAHSGSLCEAQRSEHSDGVFTRGPWCAWPRSGSWRA